MGARRSSLSGENGVINYPIKAGGPIIHIRILIAELGLWTIIILHIRTFIL